MINLNSVKAFALLVPFTLITMTVDYAYAEETSDWKISLGLGTLYTPAFTGSKDYQVVAFPDLKVEYKDDFFASLFEGVGYNLVNTDHWRAGPIAKFNFGRSEDDDSIFRIAGNETKALKGLGDIDPTAELGAFLEYKFDPLNAMVEIRQGVGGHEGLTADIGLNYSDAIDVFGPPVIFSIGPRATFADSNYNESFFGITKTQSIRSGLASYKPDAGLVSYGIGAFAMVPLSDSLSLGMFGGFDRLGDAATDSPLIRLRGDENQFTARMRVSYEFNY